jgi:hypothetical protein
VQVPVLPITNGAGKLHPLASSIVNAVTMYPEPDDRRQLQLIAIVTAQLLSELPDAVPDEVRGEMALGIVELLYHAPEPAEAWRRAVKYAANSWMAGEVLMFMVSAAIHHPEKAVTVTKAISVLAEIFHGTPTWGGGSVQMASRTAWQTWGRFKSVAHFKAVHQVWLEDKTDESGTDAKGWADLVVGRLPEYLAMAEAVRKAAVERRILDFDATWRPPSDLELPQAKWNIPPLPPEALEALDKYVPEHSKDAGIG